MSVPNEHASAPEQQAVPEDVRVQNVVSAMMSYLESDVEPSLDTIAEWVNQLRGTGVGQ